MNKEAIIDIEKPKDNDLISRQAVFKIIEDIRDCVSVTGYWAFLERLKKLPAVEPTNTGHWKRASMDRYTTHAQYWYKCDKCGELNLGNTDFCPNCGARMDEPQERSGEEC